MAFGHSRGEWPVPRSEGYEEPLQELLELAGLDAYGCPDFDCDEFSVLSYFWGECLCDDEHVPGCRADLPNFLHKPSGLELRWYKYPLRDSYMSREVPLDEWAQIIAECKSALRRAGGGS